MGELFRECEVFDKGGKPKKVFGPYNCRNRALLDQQGEV